MGWRWGRSLGMWFIPRSRGSAPKRSLIDHTAQALRDAGFGVTISIDATIGDRGVSEREREQRSHERAERLTARAARHDVIARGRDAAAQRIADGIPFGQPILVGHHSQARAERDHRRIVANAEASIAHHDQAERDRSAAQTAAASTSARQNPVTVANRIERLAAQVRREQREVNSFDAAGGDESSAYRVRRVESLAIAQADLEYWEGVRGQQVQDGTASNYSRETVKVGDAVKIRGQWRRVARCNAKSVSVETGYSWTDRAPWWEVQDHRAENTPA